MFSKAKTEAERQKIFDDYLLGILKNKKVIKKNKNIIDKNKFGFDASIDENKAKGAFNSYVDSLVIKNFLIEQIYTRLKINKSMAVNFVNKLDGNQLLILSKVVNEFIKDIQSKYFSINDYILKSSFQELQTNYNVLQQQEKNKEIVRTNQQEQGEVLEENVPAEQLGAEETKGGDKDDETDAGATDYTDLGATDEDDMSVLTGDNMNEDEKMIEFLESTIFKLKGTSKFNASLLKKALYGETFANDPDLLKSQALTKEQMDTKFLQDILTVMNKTPEEQKQKLRQTYQTTIIKALLNSEKIPDDVKQNNSNLFIPYMKQTISGNGARRKGKMLFVKGGSYAITHQPKGDEYIPLGKYKAHRTKLIGGKLQIRSHNNNQVYNLKSQNISNNIRDIFIKLNKNEKITFNDVDKLNADEKNQLYTLGKKLHITELFDIPSTLKSNEDKLKDEFNKLRGSLIAGNNSPDLLRKFKIVMLQMKNNKLISLQEYNEVLNILLEMEI
jgi:hypothetical protein